VSPRLHLDLTPWPLAVCRFGPDDPLPAWVLHAESVFYSITRTPDALSVVCAMEDLPPSVEHWEGPWRAYAVAGPLPFTMTGVVSGITTPLAEAGIPVLVIGTFDTDYLLVRAHDLDRAAAALAPHFELG
jgi:hypothetical protein